MSLNPSNGIAQRMNPKSRVFPNLARHGSPQENPDVDQQIEKELTEARIEIHHYHIRAHGEVPTELIAICHGWKFTRRWYYYAAEGPGIPPDKAEEFHRTWGTQVRVEGHCGCPSPLEWCHGFAVGSYHIDTQEGLNAFVALLTSIDTRSATTLSTMAG